MNSNKHEPIAIIGMGCRFPGGANDPYSFWRNLREGKDCITEVPSSRFGTDTVYSSFKDKPGRLITKWGGFIEGFDEFDPSFFGIAPREAQYMDPQQRKLLEVTWEALEDASQKPSELVGKDVGVFVGGFTVDYKILQFGGTNFDTLAAHTSTGAMMTMLSNRISYIFDFRGPSMTLDTACSSSITALHAACQSLKEGSSSLAIAGGSMLQLVPQYTIAESKGGFLSPTGISHPFDDSANGYVRSEGIGVVVLKRLSDALRDGDPIHALILGTGVNQDGRTNGITVPNPDAQTRLIEEVCDAAGIVPGDLQYVEAHGTSTPVGDPIEANALGQVLNKGRKPNARCFVGSVKSNLGHAESAAGMAGLIKVVMSLKNKKIPPHLHLKNLNPKIEISKWCYEIPRELVDWPDHDGPALAGVNSFGFGGSNAHAILQEAPPPSTAHTAVTRVARDRNLITLSAKDGDSLLELAKAYADALPSIELNDLGYTLGERKERLDERLSVVFSDRDELISILRDCAAGESPAAGIRGKCLEASKRKTVWVFTGMGPQWWAMGRQLFETEPVYREVIERCDREMSKLVSWSLLRELNAPEDQSNMAETWLSQPANFAVQLALAALWRSYGIVPDAIVGHSTGEAAAFYEAGVYSFEDAVKVIVARSSLQQTVSGTGKMAAVGLPEKAVRPFIAPYGEKISVAAINSPNSVTLSGNESALLELAKSIEKQGHFCKVLTVQVPFHSAYMDPIKDRLIEALRSIRPQKATVRLYSTVTGHRADGSELNAEYWWHNVRDSVLFAEATSSIVSDGYGVFLEVGPHPVLRSSIAESCASSEPPPRILTSLRRKDSEHHRVLATLGEFSNLGFPVNWSAFYAGGRFVSLPCYPWKKDRYWAEPPMVQRMRLDEAEHPLLGRRLFVSEPCWEGKLDTEHCPYLADHKIQGTVVFPAAGYIEMALGALRILTGESAYAIDKLQFKKALFLPDGEFRTAHVSVASGSSEFRIVTYDLASETSNEHATGKLRALQRFKIADTANIEAAKERIGACVDSPTCYQRFSDMGYNYGPCFQGISAVWAREGEALAHIALPESNASNIEEYCTHPSLIDACFQTFIAATREFADFEADTLRSGIRLPISIEQLRINVSSLRELWAHATVTCDSAAEMRGNITLYDNRGAAVGTITDFLAQAVDRVAGTASASTIDSWLYDVAWVPRDADAAKQADGTPAGGWLILADKEGVGARVSKQLELRGNSCCLATPGNALVFDGSNAIFSPESAEQVAELLRVAFSERGLVCAGVVHLWNLDADEQAMDSVSDLSEAKRLGCYSVLSVAKALKESASTAKLWIVTRGAQALAAHPAPINPPQAAVWGLGRVLWYQELEENRGRLIDLDPSARDPHLSADQILAELDRPGVDDEVAIRQSKRYSSRLVRMEGLNTPLPTCLREDACYVVTGAFGAIGQHLCRMLIKRGARRLLLMSRTEIPQRADWHRVTSDRGLGRRLGFINELASLGCDVITAAVDVANEAQLTSYLSEFRKLGYPPIRGVFFSAGVVKDTFLDNMDVSVFDQVYDVKVFGSYLLHKLLSNDPIEYFVLFSSIASLVTTAGQTNYAAANSFLDALAYHRRSEGLPAISVAWGPWAIGMVKELNLIEHYKLNRGMNCIEPEIGMAVLDRVLGQDTALVVVNSVSDWKPFTAWYSSIPPLVSDLAAAEQDIFASRGTNFVDSFVCADAESRQELVHDRFLDTIQAVLHVKRSQLDSSASLNQLGLDSIMAIELRNRLTNDLGHSLSVVNILSGLPISALSQKLYEGLCENVAQAEVPETSTVELATDEFAYPLSWGQKAIWFLQKLNSDSFAYNVAGAIELKTDIDVALMRKAVVSLIQRHPQLRANFTIRDGQPVQLIAPQAREDFEAIDVDGMSWEAVKARIIEIARKNFDLERDPLFRLRLFRWSTKRYIFAATIHHIVSDAISNYLSLGEIFYFYSCLKNQVEPQLPAPEATYLDFVNWQNGLLAGKRGDEMLKFWKSSLSGVLPVLNLPTDRQRPPVQTNHGDSVFFEVDQETTAAITRLSGETNATLFMVLLSGFYLLMHKYSGQDDIIIGTPVSGRSEKQFYNVYGYFVNPLPLRLQLERQETYTQLLKNVQSLTLNALDNLEYPLGLLIEKLGLQHDASRSALFQVMFVHLVHQAPSEEYGIPIKYVELPEEEGQFDLTLSVFESAETGTIQSVFKYNTDLFNRSTIERAARHYTELLRQLVSAPSTKIADYDMLVASERRQILADWRGDAAQTRVVDVPVHVKIQQQAEETPDAVAVAMPSENQDSTYLSYGELNARANQIARRLRKLGVTRDTVVGIRMRKSPALVTVVLGVLKAGAAYVPVDPDLPPERAKYIIDNSDAGWLICDEVEVSAGVPGPRLQAYASLLEESAAYSGSRLTNSSQASDTAYLIYTSGSTGVPKGVAVSHGNWVSMQRSYEPAYGLREGANSHLQMASFSFDVFAGDFVRALCTGGKLVLCPKEVLLNTPLLYSTMQKEEIRFAEFVPAVVRGVMRYLEMTGQNLSFMTGIVVSSDVWSVAEYRKLKTLCGPHTRVINTYGLTEATIDSTYFEGDAESLSDGSPVPIAGKPFDNTEVFILDEQLRPVAVGVIGELCIAGDGVAQGYVKDEELTRANFVTWTIDNREVRLFRTKDLARWDENGVIHLAGRSDHQVKVHGLRIELREVETHIKKHPSVQDAVVTVRKGHDGENTLCAYYVSHDSVGVGREALAEFLAEKIPGYMVPVSFTHVAELPLSPNGKIDTRALPEPEPHESDGARNLPESIFETGVASVWSSLLGIETPGLGDEFFALGGTSIRLVEVLLRLQGEFGVELSVNTLFQHSTLGAMAKAVETAYFGRAEDSKPYIVFNPRQDETVYCFPPAGGYSIVYKALAERLNGYSLVSFSYIPGDDKISRYADAVLEHAQGRPCRLLGYSLGGNLAFEVARELERRGCAVLDIFVLDAYRVLESFKFDEEDMKLLEDELSGHLKKHIKSAEVESHTLQIAKDYIAFSRAHVSTGDVKARVNIMLEDANDGITLYGVSKEQTWHASSRTETNIIKGFGKHEDMLDHQHVPGNARLIRELITNSVAVQSVEAGE